MVFGPVIGAGLGALAGIGVGSLVFSGDQPKNYNFIIEAADRDDNIRVPAAANITDEMRQIIPLTPDWTYWPDYERWMMINRLLRIMWPNLTESIIKTVLNVVKPMVQDMINKMPFVLAILDDITLGPYSIMDAEHLHPHITEKYFTLGDFPVRVAGMKVYHTADETCILETPVVWGSNAAFDIQVFLRIAGRRVVIPISVRDIQFKCNARMVLHMVDVMPCIGGATVSLLSTPHVDFKLHLFNGPDMMALPGVKPIMDLVIGYVVKEIALYPNSVSVPLMENFGVPRAPKGMIHVKLERITNLKSTDFITKGDPYVVFEVRPGRSQRSKVVKNTANPVYDEEFFLLVDDFVNQKLSIKVYDYDRVMPVDDLLGTTEVYFSEEEIVDTEVVEKGENGSADIKGQKVVYTPVDWIQQPLKLGVYKDTKALQLEQAGSGLMHSMSKAAAGVTAGAASVVAFVTGADAEDDANMTVIKMAMKKKDVREKQQQEAAAKKAAAEWQAKVDAGKKLEEKRKAATTAGPEALKAFEEEYAAELEALKWTEDDEKAYWAEIKRINDEKKAAAAAEAKRRKKLTKEEREAEDAEKKAAEEAKKVEDEAYELVETKVKLRGNGSSTVKKSVGQIHFTVKFMPFEEPKFDDDIELTPVKTGLQQYIPFEPPKPRAFHASVNDFQKGVLTVTIFKAAGLTQPGSLLSPDPYVELILVDCDRLRPSETQKTSVKINDNAPRWSETFDFVMISAGSTLTINVLNKVGVMDVVTSLKFSKSRFQDSMLGRVQIPVADVARNGCLKDTWALLDAESGTIEMKLQWQTCFVDQYMD